VEFCDLAHGIWQNLPQNAVGPNYDCGAFRTPLHCAASCSNVKMVRLLVENGAAVFARTISDEETARNKCEDNNDACFQYLSGRQMSLLGLLPVKKVQLINFQKLIS